MNLGGLPFPAAGGKGWVPSSLYFAHARTFAGHCNRHKEITSDYELSTANYSPSQRSLATGRRPLLSFPACTLWRWHGLRPVFGGSADGV